LFTLSLEDQLKHQSFHIVGNQQPADWHCYGCDWTFCWI